MPQDRAEREITESFELFDVQQRGWLSNNEEGPNSAPKLLNSLFRHHPNKTTIVQDSLAEMVKEMKATPNEFNTTQQEQPQTRPHHDDVRISREVFIKAVIPRVAAPHSAEEVKSAFHALVNNTSSPSANETQQKNSVESMSISGKQFSSAATESDSFIRAEEDAIWAFSQIQKSDANTASAVNKPMEFQTFRSYTNRVIHSPKFSYLERTK